MAKSVRMIVRQQIVGNHDERVLVGSDPKAGFNWGGGEEIVVTEELAANYEKSGIAERALDVVEVAALAPAEKATVETPRKRRNS